MKFALISLLLFASACASAPTAPSPARAPSSPSMGPTEFAAQKLRAKGMSPEFLALVQKNYREDQRADVL
ncbi:MAG: hypothetical protein ACXWSC_11640, partial [Bdellovibrionota bacterium]